MTLFRPLFADWRVSFYTIALGLVVATFFVARITPQLPLNALAIVILGVAWFAEGRFGTKFHLFKKAWAWPTVLLYTIYMLGIIYSDDQGEAWGVAERKLSLVLAPLLIIASSSFRKPHVAWALFIFVVSAALAMMVAYALAFIHGLNFPYELPWIDRLTYQNLGGAIAFQPIYLSLYMVFAFFAALFLCHQKRFEGQWFYQKQRVVYPLMAFFFLSVVMLSSRMELIVLFVTSGALILFFSGPISKQWKYWAILGVFLVVATGIIFTSKENRLRFTEMIDFSADYTENQYGGRSIRIEKWKNTLETWSNHWLIGTGTGDMQLELDQTYQQNGFDIALEHRFNPHNQYLQTLLTVGVAGFSVLIWWIFGLVAKGLKRRNMVLFSFGVIVALSMLTESMLERHWGIVFIAFFSVILWRDNFEYFRGEHAAKR